MKVLQIITSLNTGGAEKLIIDTVPLYQQKGIKMDVLSLKKNKTPFWNQLEKNSIGKIIGLTTGSVYNPLLVFKIIPYLKKYDLIHAHLFPVLYWVVLAKWISFSKTKIVYTEHNTNNKRREKKLFQKIDRIIYSGLHQIITISLEVDNKLKEHLKGKEKDIELIHNGVDVERYANTQALSKTEFFSKEDFILIQVSSFREQKDQPTLIRALKHLPPSFNLLLVGDGPLRDKNFELVKELELEERVKFLGIRTDIPELLKTADVVVLSSFYEGLSLSSIEGMAARPFIASNVPGLREIVKGYGLLFEQGNSNELADCILKLYNDKSHYDQVAKTCLKRAEEFDIKKMVEEYIKVYKALLNKLKS